jgi:methylmalonyl-CoA mutase
MLASEFTVRDDFPPISYDKWRALVEADLNGAPFEKKLVTHTYEGIDIQPIYSRSDFPGESDPNGFPGLPPFVRGSKVLGAVMRGADLRQEHAHPDLTVTNRAIVADFADGTTSIQLRLDAAARNGLDPDETAAASLAGRDGIMAYSVDDLDAALADVDLTRVGIALDGGAAFLPAASLLAALWQRRGVALHQVRGAFNADPLAALARDGQLPVSPGASMTMLAELAEWTSNNCPRVTAVGIDTSPYHHAGATAAQDLAFGLATAVGYLRAMTDAGLEVDPAARQMLFSFGLGTHHFLAIAKLRAARRLWWRVVDACGGSDAAGAMRIHARTSDRVLTKRDPYVNILRNTVGVFAAIVGGADVITSVPLDHVAGLPDDFSRRVARNTLLILQEEGHLHRVIDPAGGSWFLDTITDQLAGEAWSIFQEVERLGGMLAVLESGWVSDQIAAAYAPRASDIARRKEGITGVSEFPNLAEDRVVHGLPDIDALRKAAAKRVKTSRPRSALFAAGPSSDSKTAAAVTAAAKGATIGQLARALKFHISPAKIQPLVARSFAGPFEELRDATDAWQATHGRRPRVFLANMGPVSHHTARATYAKNFFEAGGFEVITTDGFQDADAAAAAFGESGATIAVICSSDKLYPNVVPKVAARLKAAGARSVVLAGNPGANEAAWREAGVDRFIYVKCDVLVTLQETLREEGVLAS